MAELDWSPQTVNETNRFAIRVSNNLFLVWSNMFCQGSGTFAKLVPHLCFVNVPGCLASDTNMKREMITDELKQTSERNYPFVSLTKNKWTPLVITPPFSRITVIKLAEISLLVKLKSIASQKRHFQERYGWVYTEDTHVTWKKNTYGKWYFLSSRWGRNEILIILILIV